MPTYDYECPQGHRFEVFQKMTDPPTAGCPECGAPAERKISGGAGFLFKGEGFYITDYRSEDYRKKASTEAPASGGASTRGTEGSTGGSGSAADGSSSSSSSTPSSSPSDG